MNLIYEYWWIWFAIWTICFISPKPKGKGIPDYHISYNWYGKLYYSSLAEYLTIISGILTLTSLIISIGKFLKG